MIFPRVILPLSLALLGAVQIATAGEESEDFKVLHTFLCDESAGDDPGVVSAMTLNTSGRAQPQDTRGLGFMEEEYDDALKDIWSRNTKSVPLPQGLTCPPFKIVSRK